MKRPSKFLAMVLTATLGCALACLMVGFTGCTQAQLDAAAAKTAALNPGTPATQPTTQPTLATDAAVALVNTGSNPLVQAAASTVPYAGLALLALVSAAAGYLKIKAAAAGTRADTAEQVIADAAPPLAAAVNKATANTAMGGAITAAGAVAPEIIALLNHPAAQAATAAITTAAKTS